MTFPILTFPDTQLQEPSVPVEKFDSAFTEFLDGLHETMRTSKGIGLAAPQVGRKIRAFVIDLSEQTGNEKERWDFVNPTLLFQGGKVTFREGCLSVPDYFDSVTRAESIRLLYQDRHGAKLELTARGLLAVAIQHEIDHLNGFLFVDRLPWYRRGWVKRKLKKKASP